MSALSAEFTAAKKALRKQTADALKALQRTAVAAQSAAVLAELASVPAYTAARSASIYLPMDGSSEVDTWPIVAALMSRGVTVAVPRVVGPKSAEMQMLRLSSYEQAVSLPRTKWGIPEPDESLAAGMEDMTSAPFDLLLVPGMAFDARCNRIGHGRGYYDCFISRQRGLPERRGGARLTVIGLGLTPQLVEKVPVAETDERLDMVVHPEGRLAYADQEDLRTAAEGKAAEAAADDGAGDEEAGERRAKSLRSEGTEAGVGLAAQVMEEQVDLKPGTYKYVCLRVTPRDAPSFLVVRSAAGSYHRDVGEAPTAKFEARGWRVEALGGGRIKFDAQRERVHIYGFSVGLGGDEGGPPGRGMPDHSQAAALVRERLPDYDVTFSADGY